MKTISIIAIFILVSCTTPKGEVLVNTNVLDKRFSNILDAHGGLAKWKEMKTLTFSMGQEQHTVDLTSRMAKIESPSKSFGFDGAEVWVMPDTAKAGNEAFMYNLYFYFFAMPFVLADPGIAYTQLEQKVLDRVAYNATKMSFGDSIGNSPKDEYIILSDPKTNRMEWLMYTATFGAKEKGEQFGLIKYGEWVSVDGILLPSLLQWMSYEGQKVGEVQGDARFENISLSAVALPKATFTKEQ